MIYWSFTACMLDVKHKSASENLNIMLIYFATALHFLYDVLALTETFLFPIHKLLVANTVPVT